VCFNSNFLAEFGARHGRSRPQPLDYSTPALENSAPPDTQAGPLAAILRRALEPFPEARRAVIDALRAESAGSLTNENPRVFRVLLEPGRESGPAGVPTTPTAPGATAPTTTSSSPLPSPAGMPIPSAPNPASPADPFVGCACLRAVGFPADLPVFKPPPVFQPAPPALTQRYLRDFPG